MELGKSSRKMATAGVVVLLLILLAELAFTVRQQSLSWDEGDHIFAGVMSWKTGDYGLNPEHPPLVKLLATLPILHLPLNIPPLQNRYFKLEAYFDGRDMIYGSGPEASPDKIIFRVRMAAALITLTLALLIFVATREMFGMGAAFLAMTLAVFEPNIIAHGAYLTTDIAISCFLFATVYAFYRYVKQPSTGRLLVVGLAAGLALGAKHSGILLFPILVLLCLYELIATGSDAMAEKRGKQALRFALVLTAITVVSLTILWAFYGFRYSARPAGLQLGSGLDSFAHHLRPLEGTAIMTMAHLHLLPESYLYGLTDVRAMANFMPSYIFGKVYAHGVWFYFPIAFLIKSTLAVLAFTLLTIFALISGRMRWSREVFYLTIPPIFYIIITLTSHLNIGIRHLLPVYVFLMVLSAGAAFKLIEGNRRWGYVTAILLFLHIFASVRSYPTYIAYANELWGGPSSTYKYLTDSNTDWGQQLKGVKKYVDQNGIKNCWFAYFVATAIEPSSYGIPCKLLPTADTGWFGAELEVPPAITGPVFLSAGSMSGYELGSSVLNPYTQFENRKPDAVIEHGVFVFNGTFQVPRASAMAHAQRSSKYLSEKNLKAALAEAQAAVSVDPDFLGGQMALAEALIASQQKDQAKSAYQKALAIARTMEPSAQEAWIPRIQKAISDL